MRARGAAAVMIAAALAGCGRESEPAAAAATPVEVLVSRAAVASVPEIFEVGGTVRARETAVISSRIVAPVAQVLVSPGDRVRAGQTLVLLDARQLDAEAARAAAALDAAEQAQQAANADREAAAAGARIARQSYDRIAALAATASATKQELDQESAARDAAAARALSSDARVREASGALSAAREAQRAAVVARSYARLTSPFDGVVASRQVDPGVLAAPGVPLVIVDAQGGFRLSVLLDQSRAAALRIGRSIDMDIDGLGRLSGRIEEIERAINPASHTVAVKIGLPDDSRLRSGVFGRAMIPGDERRLVTVPAAAIVRQGQVALVFVADGRVARLRVVREAPGDGRTVPIVAGVQPGDLVISPPPPGLLDGQPISTRDDRP